MAGNHVLCRESGPSYGNIDGSCLSPRYFLKHQLIGHQTRYTCYRCNLRRHIIEKRLQHLRISWRHLIPFLPSNSAGIYTLDMDPVEERYLLCGACNGAVSVVDMETDVLDDGTTAIQHKVVANSSTNRQCSHLISCCQWYPEDTSAFVTSSVDRSVKLWDTNRMKVVDEFPFEDQISEIHWNAASTSRIAVAKNTSDISLIDPRSGDAMQNLRWATETATTVRWSPERAHYLLSGGAHGNVVLWDVRSAKSRLLTLESSDKSASRVSGIRFTNDGLYVVTLNTSKKFEILRAQTMESMKLIKVPSISCQGDRYSFASRFDIMADGAVLRACVPAMNKVIITSLERNSAQIELTGHFHRVNACVYRQISNQVISSSNDRMILIWSPDMDEILPDEKLEIVAKLCEDTWSDDD